MSHNIFTHLWYEKSRIPAFQNRSSSPYDSHNVIATIGRFSQRAAHIVVRFSECPVDIAGVDSELDGVSSPRICCYKSQGMMTLGQRTIPEKRIRAPQRKNRSKHISCVSRSRIIGSGAARGRCAKIRNCSRQNLGNVKFSIFVKLFWG